MTKGNKGSLRKREGGRKEKEKKKFQVGRHRQNKKRGGEDGERTRGQNRNLIKSYDSEKESETSGEQKRPEQILLATKKKKNAREPSKL